MNTRDVSDATYARAEAVLGERGVLDVVAVLGYYSFIAMSMKAFAQKPEGEAGPVRGSLTPALYAAIVSFTAATSCLSVNGLARKSNLRAFGQVLLERVLGVAGHEDDLQVRIALAQFLGERRPVHLRHHHVGDDEIDVAAVALDHLDRLDAVAGFEHRVAARGRARAH